MGWKLSSSDILRPPPFRPFVEQKHQLHRSTTAATANAINTDNILPTAIAAIATTTVENKSTNTDTIIRIDEATIWYWHCSNCGEHFESRVD